MPSPVLKIDDDPLQSPQLPEKDFVPQILPRTRQSNDDGVPPPPSKDLPIRGARPTLPQRISSNTQAASSSYHDSKSQASAQLLAKEEGATSIILRAFAPHVSVLASSDCEEILRHKGIHGGLLELLRPYGESIVGGIVIRDSTGASRPWTEFGIRFIGVNDGLEPPHLTQPSKELAAQDAITATAIIPEEYRPSRLRTGGDLVQIDGVTGSHVEHVEKQMRSAQERKDDSSVSAASLPGNPSYLLYLQRLLSGAVNSPHETFSHPVTQVIAISSRNPYPIEELRNLYTSGKTGPDKPSGWVNNDFLRYYVLVHDEDYDDIKKSTALYEQMKRHFGLHCHLLRLRSTQCLASDDGSVPLPMPEWRSAAEDLADDLPRESNQEEEQRPYIFESDVAAVQSFVREMVAQSLVPMMERTIATWNDQVASRRRGLSGRFMSLSKRFTPFATGRMASVPGLSRATSDSSASTSGNYDSSTGAYKPESPEAIMRKLADYAFMLRDYKLAQSTYELIAADYKSDKAWKHFAGANEMHALTLLINASLAATASKPGLAARATKPDLAAVLDPLLENAYYNYNTRASGPYHAVRTALLAAELIRHHASVSLQRSSRPADDLATKWLSRVLDDYTLGPVGHVLVTQRVAGMFAARPAARARKAAFWNVLAACGFSELGKPRHAQRCLAAAREDYEALAREERGLMFPQARAWIQHEIGDAQSGFDEKDVLEVPRREMQTVSIEDGQTKAHTDLLVGTRDSLEPDEDGFV